MSPLEHRSIYICKYSMALRRLANKNERSRLQEPKTHGCTIYEYNLSAEPHSHSIWVEMRVATGRGPCCLSSLTWLYRYTPRKASEHPLNTAARVESRADLEVPLLP